MATLTTRANVLSRVDQENPVRGKSVAVTKKRTAAPVTRHALGTVTNQRVDNKAPTAKREIKKPSTRQQATLKPKSTQNATKKQVSDPEHAPMEMGTPNKVPVATQEDIFDRTSKPDVHNIDEDDYENPQLCSEFVNQIYQYMLHLEAEYPVKKHYLKETSLKSRMRSILVDWLIQVHHRFGLLQETLYLTIAILDRFLQIHPVVRTKLQLAGVTAMLLASKYEEMYAPEVSDFVYITDQAFTRTQILQMEILMLKTLGFNLGRPLPLHFLRRNSKAGNVDANQHALAKYLMELAMVDYEMCHVPPSQLAAAALCLSTKLIGGDDWTPTLQHYSRYSYEEIASVVCHLAKNLKAAETSTYLNAIRNKYSSQKAFRVSQIDEIKCPLVSELAAKASTISL
ncbi:G2/mitotic-specific cyclin-B2-like [Styela clava]|uniref:G2/mitotic-specific cyclin-B-like n=1 Tax=Styela clava TaxID=7725 RepID=UPI001939B7E0|nr:G2/mitotic-specific cyclin-B-like [Styela clava]